MSLAMNGSHSYGTWEEIEVRLELLPPMLIFTLGILSLGIGIIVSRKIVPIEKRSQVLGEEQLIILPILSPSRPYLIRSKNLLHRHESRQLW